MKSMLFHFGRVDGHDAVFLMHPSRCALGSALPSHKPYESKNLGRPILGRYRQPR
jgi:hypothetical protein